MLLQYVSDLHIDGWPKETPFTTFVSPTAPVLVIAGDICSAWDPRYFQFLKWTSKHWKTVVIVAGNHEYHNKKRHTIMETDNHILNYCEKRKNLIYLQYGASYTIPETTVRIVGSTLWCAPDPSMWEAAAKKKGDYRFIYVGTDEGRRKMAPSDVDFFHLFQKALLSLATRQQHPQETVVVVTHYLPSKQLLEPEFRGEAWHSFYASDDDDLFAPHIALWICGHGHRATTYKVPDGPLLAMNARGYNRECEIARSTDVYNPCAIQKVT